MTWKEMLANIYYIVYLDTITQRWFKLQTSPTYSQEKGQGIKKKKKKESKSSKGKGEIIKEKSCVHARKG